MDREFIEGESAYWIETIHVELGFEQMILLIVDQIVFHIINKIL